MGLFTTKSIETLRADAETNTLRRALGPLNLTTLGIGSIIGTGIFVLTGTAASQNAGPALIISMIIAGVGCGFAGLCYAEFSRREARPRRGPRLRFQAIAGFRSAPVARAARQNAPALPQL